MCVHLAVVKASVNPIQSKLRPNPPEGYPPRSAQRTLDRKQRATPLRTLFARCARYRFPKELVRELCDGANPDFRSKVEIRSSEVEGPAVNRAKIGHWACLIAPCEVFLLTRYPASTRRYASRTLRSL